MKLNIRSVFAKVSLPGFLFGAIILCFLAPVESAKAGTVITADKNGGYAVRYGRFSQQELTSQALSALRKISKRPENVYVYFATPNHGYGTVIRFKYANGTQSIVGVAGCATAKIAYDKCMATVIKKNLKEPKVVSKWLEE